MSITKTTRTQWKALMGDDPDIVSFETGMWSHLNKEEDWEATYKPVLDELKKIVRKEPMLKKLSKATGRLGQIR